MTQIESKQPEGVTRRQFLKFTGIGLVAGLAAMALGSRLKNRQAPQAANLDDDSMFRARSGTRPKG
ncbi:MAG: twin-arginine translocation signal domain-containing protein [Chloroflexi bacterium]|nr:twin-arginine translocation signal domain-containing protein [Chloroflexota bacterium]